MTRLSSLSDDRRRWFGLVVVCMAQLMIVLDSTIVNVALPSIQHDLHFSNGNLTWVVNAFLVTFGSFLLVAGRLSDLLGRKRVFELGLIVFTGASFLCGVAPSQGLLIGARFLQGIGAAMQASVILAIIVTEFPQPAERAKAMSAYVFTAVAGGSLGLLIGGLLTQALSWHWIFFVNLPIGAGTLLLSRSLIRRDSGIGLGEGLDWLGSVLVTLSLMTGIYAIVQATNHGWGSDQVLGFGAIAALLMAAFLTVEARISNPIMPLHILRLRGLIGGSAARGMLVPAMYATFFLGTLYLEGVLHYSAVKTGLAFLPWTLTVAALSMGLNRRFVTRFGPMPVLVAGMTVVIGGLIVLTTTTPSTGFFPTVFVAFLMIGFGIGNAFMPLMTMAMAGVPAQEAGLASAITSISQQAGGAFGIAILSTFATNHTKALLSQGIARPNALVGGYHLAYTIGIGSVIAAIVIALAVLRTPKAPIADEVLEVELGVGGEEAIDVELALRAETAAEPAPVPVATIQRRIIVPTRRGAHITELRPRKRIAATRRDGDGTVAL